jgi:hypothetical protein
MAEKAIFTGNVLDDFVEVKMRYNMIRYAKPVYTFPLVAIPTQAWLDKYGDNYWAMVDYDRGNEQDLILVGMLPKEGKNFPPEGLDGKYYFYTEKFRIFIDDVANTYSIESNETGGVINLGTKEATIKAVLGDTLVSKLDTLIDLLKAAKVNTAIGPQPFMADTQLQLSTLKDGLNDILSAVVKLV